MPVTTKKICTNPGVSWLTGSEHWTQALVFLFSKVWVRFLVMTLNNYCYVTRQVFLKINTLSHARLWKYGKYSASASVEALYFSAFHSRLCDNLYYTEYHIVEKAGIQTKNHRNKLPQQVKLTGISNIFICHSFFSVLPPYNDFKEILFDTVR